MCSDKKKGKKEPKQKKEERNHKKKNRKKKKKKKKVRIRLLGKSETACVSLSGYPDLEVSSSELRTARCGGGGPADTISRITQRLHNTRTHRNRRWWGKRTTKRSS